LYLAFRPNPIESQVFIFGNALIDRSMERSDSIFVNGKSLLQNHCSSCHSLTKNTTGPALAQISPVRSPYWICRFITEPKFLPNDELAVDLRKQYGLSCMKFPQLNCKDIDAMLRFVDYRKF
jgi:mono/diheme cytochrome c family protein